MLANIKKITLYLTPIKSSYPTSITHNAKIDKREEAAYYEIQKTIQILILLANHRSHSLRPQPSRD